MFKGDDSLILPLTKTLILNFFSLSYSPSQVFQSSHGNNPELSYLSIPVLAILTLPLKVNRVSESNFGTEVLARHFLWQLRIVIGWLREGWLVGWLVGWLAGWLVGWLVLGL